MRILIITILAFIVGCASNINKKNAANYHQAGARAESRGDFIAAEQNYERALLNAKLGNSPKSGISMASYNLGRIKAELCKLGEANELLSEALSLEEKVSGPESVLTIMRLLELARVNAALNKKGIALDYYERGIKAVRSLDIEKSDPIGLSLVLDNYAVLLKDLNQLDKYEATIKESKSLKTSNAGKQAGFKPRNYGENCP